MGGLVSKIDQQVAVGALEKEHNSDDLFSRSTVTTADSSLCGSKKSGSRSYPYIQQASSGLRRAPTIPSNLHPNLQRRHSDADQAEEKQMKRTEPVKCPPRKSNSLHGFCESSVEGEDSQYLMRMYDSRTWQMYRRITEARKNAPVSYASCDVDRTEGNDCFSEWENLQHDYMDSSSNHEMVFLFDSDWDHQDR